MRIILDCDLMKHPNSGLFHYCLNLGLTVSSLLDKEKGEKMVFYGPASAAPAFGENANFIVEKRSVWDLISPVYRNYDIWHAPFQSGRILPRKKRSRGPRILLTIHDLNTVHEGKPLEEQINSLEHTQSLIDRADAVVCISEFCKRDVLRYCKVGDKKIFVIHNGTHKVGEPELNPGSVIPRRPFLFGMGYINRKKNYHVLLPLLKDENLEMIIAGRLDEPDYIEAIKQQAIKMGVNDRLHLPGPVSEGEKSWYLQHCLAFVHPSLAEGFGAPVVEAMQFGKPLFLSSLTSLPEIAGEAGCFFKNFDPWHIQEVFYSGMKEYSRNGMAAKIMNKSMEYDWQLKGKEYLEVYRELAQ